MKKIVLSLFLLFLSLFQIDQVNASSVYINGAKTGTSLEMPAFMTYYDITSASSVNMLTTNTDVNTQTYNSTFTTIANSYGGIMAMKLNAPLVNGYVYAISLYNYTQGSFGALSTIPTVGISDGMRNASQASLVGDGAWTLYRGIAGTSRVCVEHTSTGLLNCQDVTVYTFVFKAIYTSDAVAFPYTTSPTCTDCFNQFWGYSIQSLGAEALTTEQIQNVIDNSSLATAESVEEVNQGISEVKQELSGVNDSLNDLNDNITSQDGPTNLGALDNSAGWLPPGPVDSILNLPLSLINSLLTAISSTCQPLNLTFPFIDFNYKLPCISSIYSQINGLNAIIDLIGYTVGVFILYYYFKHLYKWVDKKLTLQHSKDWGGI